MPHKEAVEDGIRTSSYGIGTMYYYPICSSCHKNEVPTWSYERGRRYVCKECKAIYLTVSKDNRVNVSFDEKEKKFCNAVKRIQKKSVDFFEYDSAIKVIHSKLHNDGWFESTEEIMVAIELVKSGIKARHQVKFGNYRIDFLLPDQKVVLEIDGRIYHGEDKVEKERFRDNCILLALGADWEVIRIPTDIINQNITKLVEAIEMVKSERKRIRNNNGGLLPYWYTEKEI